nr:MAG TPA: hypothetical protein [Caudoviricetes sp.]
MTYFISAPYDRYITTDILPTKFYSFTVRCLKRKNPIPYISS